MSGERTPALPNSLPYGPATVPIRRFLLRLAGLGGADRSAVVHRYADGAVRTEWARAERALAEAIERSGRSDAQNAISGPLLQLVRRESVATPDGTEDPLAALDPIAEPALAALLALMAQDLLREVDVATLYDPFEAIIPRAGILSPG